MIIQCHCDLNSIPICQWVTQRSRSSPKKKHGNPNTAYLSTSSCASDSFTVCKACPTGYCEGIKKCKSNGWNHKNCTLELTEKSCQANRTVSTQNSENSDENTQPANTEIHNITEGSTEVNTLKPEKKEATVRVTILEEGSGQSPPGATLTDPEDIDLHREGSEQSPTGATLTDSEDIDPHREGSGQSPTGANLTDSEDIDPHREGSEQSPTGANLTDTEDSDPHRDTSLDREIPTGSPIFLESRNNTPSTGVTNQPIDSTEDYWDHQDPGSGESPDYPSERQRQSLQPPYQDSTGSIGDHLQQEQLDQSPAFDMAAMAKISCMENPSSDLCTGIRNTYFPTKDKPSQDSNSESDMDLCGDTLDSATTKTNCLNWAGLRSSGLDEFLASMTEGNLNIFPGDAQSMFTEDKFSHYRTATSMLAGTKMIGARTAFGLLLGLTTNVLSQVRQHRVENFNYQAEDEDRSYLLSIPTFVLAALYLLILSAQIMNWFKFRTKKRRQIKAKKADIEAKQMWTEMRPQAPYNSVPSRELQKTFRPR